MSIQDIRQNPQDTSNFYLANMYQATIVNPDRSNISSSLPTSPPPFSPPTYAVWVNSLWFLSLAISITCALLATLIQQWARRYLNATQTHYDLPKRAHIHSFFAEGVEKSLLPLAVEALPTLIHISLFLFFAGLAVFLWNVNLTIFKVVLSWISVCTTVYGILTLTPILYRNSPYYTPLTLLAWPIFAVIPKVFLFLCEPFYILVSVCCGTCSQPGRTTIFGSLTRRLYRSLNMTAMTTEKVALASPSTFDARALMWTFDRLDEDHKLQRFFSGLPGFHNSRVLKEPLHSLDDKKKLQLLTATIGLLDRTFSSDLLPDQVKRQRADVCTNTIDLLDTPTAFPEIVRRLATEDGCGPVKTTKLLQFIQRWGNRKGEDSTRVQALFSIVVARARQQDDSWFSLASELGILEPFSRSHAARGDISLAILIYVTRQQFVHIQNPSWPSEAIANVLEGASRFNVQGTSPKLQHEFCALWNQVIRQAKNDSNNWHFMFRILRRIRNVYVSLHKDTDCAPRFTASTDSLDVSLNELSEYPVCNVAGHIIDESASMTLARTIPVGGVVPATVPSTNPDAPSLSEPTPLHVDESPTTLPALENSHTTHQAVEGFPIPITSPGSTTASAIQDVVTLDITAPYPTTAETSISIPLPLPSPTSPPSAVYLRHNAPLTPPDSLNFLSSYSNPVLDNMLPTGSRLS